MSGLLAVKYNREPIIPRYIGRLTELPFTSASSAAVAHGSIILLALIHPKLLEELSAILSLGDEDAFLLLLDLQAKEER